MCGTLPVTGRLRDLESALLFLDAILAGGHGKVAFMQSEAGLACDAPRVGGVLGRGWLGLDPTFGVPVAERHVVVDRRRAYGDVKGVYQGPPDSSASVTVEVIRLA
jgi:hypothetical protein